MKKLVSVVLMIASVSAVASQEKTKIIYGEDDRKEVIDEKNPMIRSLSKSVAVMVKRNSIQPMKYNWMKKIIKSSTLKETVNTCTGERFADQTAPGYCTGFLVGDKYLVTAGHCIADSTDCAKYKWVFDFKVGNKKSGLKGDEITVKKSAIYGCKKVITTSQGKYDHALIELDKKVKDRRALKVRTSGKPTVGTELFVIGHPMGLPMKVAGGAEVRRYRHSTKFMTNLDTYGGNSGSPVFNAHDGVVEGILVDGDRDFNTTWRGCRKSNMVSNSLANEGVSTIGQIQNLKYYTK